MCWAQQTQMRLEQNPNVACTGAAHTYISTISRKNLIKRANHISTRDKGMENEDNKANKCLSRHNDKTRPDPNHSHLFVLAVIRFFICIDSNDDAASINESARLFVSATVTFAIICWRARGFWHSICHRRCETKCILLFELFSLSSPQPYGC